MFIHVLPRIFKFNPRARKWYRDVCCKRRFLRAVLSVEFDVVLNF